MTSFDFEAALRQSLPPELRAIAAPLTVFLEDIFTGKLGNEEANGVILEIPEFRDAVRALEGHEIRSKDAVISFGSGSNLGDITINGNVAGRDIVNLSVSLNIMETPPFNLAGVVTSFLILVAVVILVFISSDIRNSIARVFPAPQATEAISTRVSSETLIIIASFYYTEGNKNTEVHNEIVQALRRELLRLNLTNIRIETTKETIRAGEDEVAEAIGAQYDADIIIWGEDTGARVAVNFLNRRATQMGMDSLITINETDRTQIADPPAYSQFITNDLPKQVTFLSLYAIAQTSDRNSAIKLLEQSVVSLPNETALYGLANAYYTLGDWYYGPGQNLQLAIDYYSRSIQAGNNSTTVYHNRGIARWKVGDRVGAVEDFEETIRINPDLALAYYSRGYTRQASSDWNGALADYSKAIELDPKLAIAYHNRALIRGKLLDFEGVLADYNSAIAIDPAFTDAYYSRSLFWESRGNNEQALADLNQAITLEPKNSALWYRRSIIYSKSEKWEPALSDISEAIRIKPLNVDMLVHRATIYISKSEYNKALEDCNSAIEQWPNHSYSNYLQGYVLHRLGRYNDAIVGYTVAINNAPENAGYFMDRGLAYRDLGFIEEARNDFQQVLLLNPTPELHNYAKLELEMLIQ